MSDSVSKIGGVGGVTQSQEQAVRELNSSALTGLRTGKQPEKAGQYAYAHAEDASREGEVSVFAARGHASANPRDQFHTLVGKAADELLGSGKHRLGKQQLDNDCDPNSTAQFMRDLANQGVLSLPSGFDISAEALTSAWGSGANDMALQGLNSTLADALKAAMSAPYMQSKLAQMGQGMGGVSQGGQNVNGLGNVATGNMRPSNWLPTDI